MVYPGRPAITCRQCGVCRLPCTPRWHPSLPTLCLLKGFSTISSQPCGGYSWKANECHLKPTGELTKSSNSAFTSGGVSTPRNFSAGAVVATPPKTGESNGGQRGCDAKGWRCGLRQSKLHGL